MTEITLRRKSILDPCCGSRMMWFDKQNPNVVYCDNRATEETLCDGRTLVVAPDIIADVRQLDFPDDWFCHIVLDPPHLRKAGPRSWQAAKYGKLPEDWQAFIHEAFAECWRVLAPKGTLIFKWCEYQIPLAQVLEAIGHQPLYGHRSGKQQLTHWLAFVKLEGGEFK